MPGYTNPGKKDVNTIYIADWEEIWFTPSGGTKVYLGASDNAVVIMGNTFVEADTSDMPRKLAKRVCVKKTMEFKADLKEVNSETLAILLGKDPNSPGTADAPEGTIIYHGARVSEVYGALHATGRYDNGDWAECHMYEAYAVNEETPWAGGAQVNPIPLHMRGRHTSGQDNLGWCRAPDQS